MGFRKKHAMDFYSKTISLEQICSSWEGISSFQTIKQISDIVSYVLCVLDLHCGFIWKKEYYSRKK